MYPLSSVSHCACQSLEEIQLSLVQPVWFFGLVNHYTFIDSDQCFEWETPNGNTFRTWSWETWKRVTPKCQICLWVGQYLGLLNFIGLSSQIQADSISGSNYLSNSAQLWKYWP